MQEFNAQSQQSRKKTNAKLRNLTNEQKHTSFCKGNDESAKIALVGTDKWVRKNFFCENGGGGSGMMEWLKKKFVNKNELESDLQDLALIPVDVFCLAQSGT